MTLVVVMVVVVVLVVVLVVVVVMVVVVVLVVVVGQTRPRSHYLGLWRRRFQNGLNL
jgi:hypothetical protein